MRLALALAALVVASSAMADSLPHFRKGTPYTAVRTKMLALGYTPFMTPDADKCDPKDDSRCFPEIEACAGTGLGNCNFDWQKAGRKVQVSTIGEPPTFDWIGAAQH